MHNNMRVMCAKLPASSVDNIGRNTPVAFIVLFACWCTSRLAILRYCIAKCFYCWIRV